MRVSRKSGIFLSAIFVLLSGICCTPAYAGSDDGTPISTGKQTVYVAPTPVIQFGDPGDEPHLRTGAVRSVVDPLSSEQDPTVIPGGQASRNPDQRAIFYCWFAHILRQLL